MESVPAAVAFDGIGRLVERPAGDTGDDEGPGKSTVWVARRADYSGFMRWLEQTLTSNAENTAAPAGVPGR